MLSLAFLYLLYTSCQGETAEKSLYKQYWVLPAVPDFLKNPSFLFLSLYQVIFTSFFKVVLPLFSPILTV